MVATSRFGWRPAGAPAARGLLETPSASPAPSSAMAPAGSLERQLLTLTFILVIVIYAALGRDLLSNRLVQGTNDDAISAILPYLRVAICAFGFVIIGFRGSLGRIFAPVPMIFAPFLLLALASAGWSGELTATLRVLAGLVALWLVLPAIMQRLGVERVVRVMLHIIGLVMILSALIALAAPSIGQHTGLEVMQQSHAGRWRGIFSHKNSLGAWAALGTALSFTQVRLAGFAGLYWALVRLCALACLLGAGSATSIVVAAAMLALWAGLQLFRQFPPVLAVSLNIMLMALAALAGLTLYEPLLEVLGRSANLTGRPIIWAIADQFISMRPWLGYGYGTNGGADFLDYVFRVVGQAIPGPESGYRLVVMETGMVGAGLFFLGVGGALLAGFRRLSRPQAPDRAATEFMILVAGAALATALTESSAFIYYGPVAILTYSCLFALASPGLFARVAPGAGEPGAPPFKS